MFINYTNIKIIGKQFLMFVKILKHLFPIQTLIVI